MSDLASTFFFLTTRLLALNVWFVYLLNDISVKLEDYSAALEAFERSLDLAKTQGKHTNTNKPALVATC